MRKLKTLGEKVWSKVEFGEMDQCWRWIGAHGKHGHGHLLRGGRGTPHVNAHRAAYELIYGSIPSGLEVCHRCDVRDCCNPRHLFLGTHRENMTDMARKERSPRRRLTGIEVTAIHNAWAQGGVTKTDLSRRYGVSRVQIANIVSGRHWCHLAR